MSRWVQRDVRDELTWAGWSARTECPTGVARRRCDVFATHPDADAALVVEAKRHVHAGALAIALAQTQQYLDDFTGRGIDVRGLIVVHHLNYRRHRELVADNIFLTDFEGLHIGVRSLGLPADGLTAIAVAARRWQVAA